jgi:tetratricopeptide (TPR) repeat protein
LEPLPNVELASVDADVASLLDKARQNVLADRGSAIAWGDLGAVLRAHDYGPEAEACFRNAARLDPADYRWPYLLGVSLSTTDVNSSLEYLRIAAKLASDRPHVQLRLAEALLGQDMLDEASAAIDRALQAAPDEARAQYDKAQLHFARGELPDSRQWCERSIAGAADKRAPHLLLAQLCRRLGDASGAVRETAAVASLPDDLTQWDDPDVSSLMDLRRDENWQVIEAEQMSAEGRVPEATERLLEIARTRDLSGDATDKLVRELLGQGRPSEAEALLREKLVKDPDSERLHFQLGIALFGQKNYAAAAAEFRRVIELKPDSVDANYNLGHALRKAGQDDEARRAFADTVLLSPGHAFARANLAEMLLDAGQTKEARPHLEVAARLAPRDPKVRELLARLPPSGP